MLIVNLNFQIEKQILTRTDGNVIVNKSKNYLKCIFTFKSDEWDYITKFAIFKDSWGHAHKIFLGREDVCECMVPNGVLRGTNFKVSVYAGDLITTNELNVILIPSGYTTNFTSPEGFDEKDVFVEIFEELDSKVDNVIHEGNMLYCYAGDVVICEVPLISLDDLSDVAISGDFTDLINVPSKFPPMSHAHQTKDISDFEDNVEGDMDLLLISLTDKIIEM